MALGVKRNCPNCGAPITTEVCPYCNNMTGLDTKYADIYFALLHELVHCKSDFNRAKSGSIVTTEDKSVEDYEIKADKTAFNWMIDDKVYQSIKYCSDVIEKLDVIKSFYVYRLVRDKLIDYGSKIYQEYNRLIEE